MRRKVGIYGGSFDPIHTGHAIVANYMSQWGGLDEVWLMVSPCNPLKQGRITASPSHRLEMARLVAQKCRNVKVSDFEMTLPQPSYTFTTLCALRDRYPDCHFSLIVGSDCWEEFRRWRNSDRIISEFGIIVYPRPGVDLIPPPIEGVTMVKDAPMVEISSTFIRHAIERGDNVAFFLPPEVDEYIMHHRIY